MLTESRCRGPKIRREVKGRSAVHDQNLFIFPTSRDRFAFFEFDSAGDANFALNAMNGVAFDSRHKFLINRFTDIESFAHMDEAFAEPTLEAYKPKASTLLCMLPRSTNSVYQQEHLRAWLADDQGRDQFITYRGDDVEVHWHGRHSQTEVAYKKAVSR